MRGIQALIALAIVGSTLAGGAPIPPPPADGILDDARLLDDKARAKVKSVRDRLAQEFDVDLYVAAYTLLSGDLNDHARKLRDSWLKSSRGMVMVYRRGNQEIAFSANEQEEYFIPPAKLYRICSAAVQIAKAHEDPRDRIVAAVASLGNGIADDLSHRDPKRDGLGADVLKLLAGFAAVALIIGGAGYVIATRLARRRLEQEAALRFPEVVVGERLGAPFGGGTVAQISYQKAMSSPGPEPANSPQSPLP